MKRILLLGSAWTASAAAAVGLGFLAISLVDASASPGGQPVVAALTSGSDDSPSTSAVTATSGAEATSSPAPVPSGQQATEGGTVYGSCDGGVPVVASAPAAGWWLDDSSDPAKIEFQNGTQQIEVRVTCVDGVAQFSVEGPRTDDNGGHGSDDGTTSAPAATTSSTGDDSDGRVGGGHGQDDGVAP